MESIKNSKDLSTVHLALVQQKSSSTLWGTTVFENIFSFSPQPTHRDKQKCQRGDGPSRTSSSSSFSDCAAASCALKISCRRTCHLETPGPPKRQHQHTMEKMTNRRMHMTDYTPRNQPSLLLQFFLLQSLDFFLQLKML